MPDPLPTRLWDGSTFSFFRSSCLVAAAHLGLSCSSGSLFCQQADKRQSPLHLPVALAERGVRENPLTFAELLGKCCFGTAGVIKGSLSPCPYIPEGDVVEALWTVALCRCPARYPSLFQAVPAPSSYQPHDDEGQEQTEHHLRHKIAGGFLCRGRKCCEALPTAQRAVSSLSPAP